MSLTKDIQAIRRGCGNKEIRALLVAALKAGSRYKMTTRGVMLYGEDGLTVTIHLSVSDHRAHKNLRRDMRRAKIKGIT